MDDTKTCTKCGVSYPATVEFFHRSKTKKYGLDSRCKSCKKMAQAALVACRRQKILVCKTCSRCGQLKCADQFYVCRSFNDGRSHDCKDCRLAYMRGRYRDQREEILDYHREHRQKNRERLAAYDRARQPQKTDRMRERAKENPEWWTAYNKVKKAARMARIRNAEGSHGIEDIRQRYREQKGCCWWCGKRVGDSYHVDHAIPLSRGGSNGPENIRISCAFCNQSKCDKTPEEFAGRLF